MDQPIVYRWTGEHFEPSTNYQAHLAEQRYGEGQLVALVEFNERSEVSHKHEFAWLRAAWASLPDHLVDQYPNAEILRKHALIAKGHCTMKQHVCASTAEAKRLATILKPYDAYAIVRQRGPVVTVYTAVSQSYRSMGAKMFQQSKSDIIDFVAGLLGVDPDVLAKQSEAA